MLVAKRLRGNMVHIDFEAFPEGVRDFIRVGKHRWITIQPYEDDE